MAACLVWGAKSPTFAKGAKMGHPKKTSGDRNWSRRLAAGLHSFCFVDCGGFGRGEIG